MKSGSVPAGVSEDRIRAVLHRLRDNTRSLETRWDEFIASHRGSWVLVDNGQAAFGDSLEAARGRAAEDGLDMRLAAVGHLDDNNPPRLLFETITLEPR